MSTSLPSVVDNLSEIYSKKCRDKNCESECDLLELKIKNYSTNQQMQKEKVKTNEWINYKVFKDI